MDDKRLHGGADAGSIAHDSHRAAAALACGSLGRVTNVFADAEDAVNKSFAVTTVNHLSYASENYKVTRDFYVDFSACATCGTTAASASSTAGRKTPRTAFTSRRAKPGTAPAVGHFSFGLPDYWKRSNELRDELHRRKLPGVHPDGEAGWFVTGPSGYTQHIVAIKDAAMFPGAAAPCEVARSDKCKDAYALGVKNAGSFPQAGRQRLQGALLPVLRAARARRCERDGVLHKLDGHETRVAEEGRCMVAFRREHAGVAA